MRLLVLGTFLLACGCTAEPQATQPAQPEVDKKETAEKKEKGEKYEKLEPPPPKTKSDAEHAKALVGKWDGLQILRNARGAVPLDGLVTLEEGGVLKFDGQARQGGTSRQIIGFGTWKVKDGQLLCVVEGSNVSKDVPNGSARAVQIREIDEKEFLYIDPNDQRTYSAKRVTGAAPPPVQPKKK